MKPSTSHRCEWSDYKLTSRKKPRPWSWERKTVRCRTCGRRLVREVMMFDKNMKLVGVMA